MSRDVGFNAARVLACLSAAPRTMGDIALLTGLPRRRVEEAVEAIRKGGVAPVCSDGRGLWLARDVAEYQANVDGRRRRAVGQLVTVREERRLVRRLLTPGQGRLWERST